MKRTTAFLLFVVFSSSLLLSQTVYHGVPPTAYPTYPLWQEQAFLVMTNVVRMAPAGFRDTYMSPAYTILLPQNYPAVNPLFWNVDLNRSSRFYALDMANNCGWISNHNSCDGTAWDARIKSFYTASGWLAENKATGYSAPQQTLIQLLKDTVASLGALAADKSANDGHRQNIMSTNYKEAGAGYAYSSTKTWYHFWVQDFGGGTPVFADRPIVAGTHLFLETNKTTFMANYYESGGGAPQSASVVIGGTSYTMTLHLGTASRGSYSVAVAKASACRNYYFSFKDSKGAAWLYPERGQFSTFGEGTCAKYYMPPESISTEIAFEESFPAGNGISAALSHGMLLIRMTAGTTPLKESRLLNPAGRVLERYSWEPAHSPYGNAILRMPLHAPLAPGVYILLNHFADDRKTAMKVICLP